jgi:hypothetical protein
MQARRASSSSSSRIEKAMRGGREVSRAAAIVAGKTQVRELRARAKEVIIASRSSAALAANV